MLLGVSPAQILCALCPLPQQQQWPTCRLQLWQVPPCSGPLRDWEEGCSLLWPQSCHTSHVQACLRHLYFSGSYGHPAWRPSPWEQKQYKARGLGRASWPVGRRCWSLQEPSPPSPGAGGGCAFQFGHQPCVCTEKLRHRQPGATGLPGRPLQVAGKAVSKPQGRSWAAGGQQGARLVTGLPSPPGSPSAAASG